MKKTVCYIGNSETTCDYISELLSQFLGDYIDVKVWCLQHESRLPYPTCDIYVAASHTVFDIVGSQLPSEKPRIIADRIINSENLDRLFELHPGTRVIVVGIWKEVAQSTIEILKNLGFNYLELVPYYPGSDSDIPQDIDIAISPGVDYLVPRHIKKIINVGVRGVDISTFAELIQHLGLSIKIVNEISHNYIETILNLSLKQYKMACLNNELKRKIEVILNTVDEAIVAVNENNRVIVFNPAAERHLDINSIQAIERDVREVIPQVDFLACLQTGQGLVNEIKRINGNYYIVSTSPVNDDAGATSGVVATFRPVGQVKELEVKVRRELKNNTNIAKATFSHIVGESEELQKAVKLAKKFSGTDLNILLEGESGTGKELFAQSIHNYSTRKDGSFVAINFAAIPENLVESELFGYEEGAFTGAKKGGKAGLFEEAHMGTIFLDEIGDASMEVQKRLLRVLEDKKVRRVGGNVLTPVDVRVVAATNKDLEELMRQGDFREDLFYRLCTLPVPVPSLRTRGQDIFILISYFTRRLYNRELILETPLKDFLLNYRWPGNIRELQNVVKYLCSMVGSDEAATIRHLPPYLARNKEKRQVPDDRFNKDEDKYEVLINQLQRQGLFKPVMMILNEVHKSSLINKGLGRNALQKSLYPDSEIADHKMRQWLKTLDEIGYIDSGKTRQGSKITREGELFLEYVKKKYSLNAVDNLKAHL